jgi:methionine-rich copper-binding protein CopC
MKTIWMLLLASAMAFGGQSHPALAHAKMVKSVPANGATARAGLSDLTLGFSKPVRVTLVKVKRTDKPIDIQVVKKGKPDFANSYNVTVTPLEPGAYDVNWTGVAKDGHVMKGTLSFKIEP